MSKYTEAEKRYFDETVRVLQRGGFQVEQAPAGPLKVGWNDAPLCEVAKIGGITYRNEDVATIERMAAKDKV